MQQLGLSLFGAASGVHCQRGGTSQMWPPAVAQLDGNARTMHVGGGSLNETPWNLPSDIPL
jgi:hypothetical protein